MSLEVSEWLSGYTRACACVRVRKFVSVTRKKLLRKRAAKRGKPACCCASTEGRPREERASENHTVHNHSLIAVATNTQDSEQSSNCGSYRLNVAETNVLVNNDIGSPDQCVISDYNINLEVERSLHFHAVPQR